MMNYFADFKVFHIQQIWDNKFSVGYLDYLNFVNYRLDVGHGVKQEGQEVSIDSCVSNLEEFNVPAILLKESCYESCNKIYLILRMIMILES